MNKTFYNWACGATSTGTIEQAITDELDVISTIETEILSDESNESMKLLAMYKDATEEERAIMDTMLVDICGWTMGSIIMLASGREKYL